MLQLQPDLQQLNWAADARLHSTCRCTERRNNSVSCVALVFKPQRGCSAEPICVMVQRTLCSSCCRQAASLLQLQRYTGQPRHDLLCYCEVHAYRLRSLLPPLSSLLSSW
jgi:hypothetical protein